MDRETRNPGQTVEYAASGRSSCKRCQGSIAEGELRIGHETRSSFHDGFDTAWMHVKCFHAKFPNNVKVLERDLRHHETLRWRDQQALRKLFEGEEGPDAPILRAHSERLWEVRDALAECCRPKDMKTLLEANGMTAEGKASAAWLMHRVADALAFGRIGLCPVCKTDGLVHNSKEYVCYGHISEFTRCNFRGDHPDIRRFKFVIPKGVPKGVGQIELKNHPTEKFVAQKRARDDDSSGDAPIAKAASAVAVAEAPAKKKGKKKDAEGAAAPPPSSSNAALSGMSFALIGTKADVGVSAKEFKELVEGAGGTVDAQLSGETTALVAGAKELAKAKPHAKIAAAKSLNVAIVDLAYLRALVQGGGDEKAEKAENNAEERPAKRELSGAVVKYREKPIEGSDILKTPEGRAGEVLVTHDAEFGYTPYNAVLNIADVTTGTNKFYRMAVLKKGKKFEFYTVWGRIGTDNGGDMSHEHSSQADAIAEFEEKFEKFCKFRWSKRHRYVKQPGAYQWVALDDGVEAVRDSNIRPSKISKSVALPKGGAGTVLDPRVRAFLSLIFDVQMMQETLVKFNVDVKKMPLGKLNSAQLLRGYEVLSTVSELLKEASPNPALLDDASNRFYTLIPHDFGHNAPPVINSMDALKAKLSLVEALLELGDSVEVMTSDSNSADPLLGHYASLRSEIVPLDKGSERFAMLSKYMHEGHDKSNFEFGMKVRDIFEIRRQDEGPEHSKVHSSTGNRFLLWHGSRMSNWGGIIGKGLRIAPPEAPTTGYRLGKGIYLADTVSKSGSYCFTDASRPAGVMMLAEAALGRQWTTKKDKYMDKPQPDSDSTMALGAVAPDPKSVGKVESVCTAEEVQVPFGAPKATKHSTSNFTHNEYVVYDIKQVTMRYLFIVDFDHQQKRGRR